MKGSQRFDVWILSAFWTAALVVICLTFVTWFVTRHATDATRRVAQTHELLHHLVHTRGDALNVELSTQNFRLTGNIAYLRERDATIQSRERLLHRIRELTLGNGGQHERWKQLRAVIDERVRIAREVEALRKAEGADAAARYVATAPLQQTRERMYRLMGDMEADERMRLDERVRAQDKANARVLAAESMVSTMLFLFLAGTYLLFRRQSRQTETSRRALAESEESLSITLRSIGDAVLATDSDGRVVNMNPIAEALTGWPLSQAKGRPATEILRLIHELTREPAEVPVGPHRDRALSGPCRIAERHL